MIGYRIRELRLRSLMTQSELAERAGLSTGYIQQLELGKKLNPSGDALISFSKIFSVTTDYLLGLSIEENEKGEQPVTWQDSDIIIKALQKQTPMKPVDKETEYACGQCDTHVAYKDDYCWKCGQKLDWED